MFSRCGQAIPGYFAFPPIPVRQRDNATPTPNIKTMEAGVATLVNVTFKAHNMIGKTLASRVLVRYTTQMQAKQGSTRTIKGAFDPSCWSPTHECVAFQETPLNLCTLKVDPRFSDLSRIAVRRAREGAGWVSINPLAAWKPTVLSFAVHQGMPPLAFIKGDWHRILCLKRRVEWPQCPSAASMLHVILVVSLVNESNSDECAIGLTKSEGGGFH